MVTLGFNTFIQNPFLNKPIIVKVVPSPFDNSMPEPSLKTIKARYNKYPAPNSLMIQNKVSLRLMISDTPKANKVVCTKQPVIKPATTASPYFFPLAMLKVSTKILSGPGEKAKAAVANIKPIRIVSSNNPLFCVPEKYKFQNLFVP